MRLCRISLYFLVTLFFGVLLGLYASSSASNTEKGIAHIRVGTGNHASTLPISAVSAEGCKKLPNLARERAQLDRDYQRAIMLAEDILATTKRLNEIAVK